MVVSLSILLAGGSLVCLSRGSWSRGDQVQDDNSTAGLVVDVEPELDPQREQMSSKGTYLLCRQAEACYKRTPTHMSAEISTDELREVITVLTSRIKGPVSWISISQS